MKKICLFFLFVLGANFIKAQSADQASASDAKLETGSSVLTNYKIMEAGKDQWVFTIFMGTFPMLQSINVPGLEHIKTFNNKQTAELLAAYIANKIASEPYPFKPISQRELDNAGILLKL